MLNSVDNQDLEGGSAEIIYNAMRSAIEHLPPGTKLPSERELMERNNVKRQTARVVLNRLMTEGLVERKIGSGTFVRERCQSTDEAFTREDVDAGLIDILEARRGLDPLIVELATERASPKEIEKMGAILEQLIASNNQRDMKRHAYDFQMALASATRNPLLQVSYEILVQCRRNLGWDQLKWHGSQENSREDFIRRQTELFEAIKQRDRFTAVSLVLRDLDRLHLLAMGPRLKQRPSPSNSVDM